MIAAPKTRPRCSAEASQAKAQQRVMFELALNPEVKESVRAQCSRVWCLLFDARRVLAMKPAPKAVDVDKWKAMRAKAKPQATSIPDEERPKESL